MKYKVISIDKLEPCRKRAHRIILTYESGKRRIKIVAMEKSNSKPI